MQLSDATRIAIALILLTVPTIQYGGYFLLTQMGKVKVIRTELQRSYYRAGHAHAGVLVLLALIAQLVIEATQLSTAIQLLLRVGFASAPILISAGFFGAAPREGTKPTRFILLIYLGAIALTASLLTLGLGLLFQ
ncbi:hypothetical protein [Leptothoe sp. PORK10 BA2]|uniref:hypothetical protein n=1 Tax=Leptothoe sp. PORK10 BA2 TaxID=3110254 RepID=UPI002B1ED714|nr:hypothetical protein [Leptothoe sp. PORK10 BA2]MEA5467149.1 hypothetical protein [Leptothoe sp. PORK10 BA2]